MYMQGEGEENSTSCQRLQCDYIVAAGLVPEVICAQNQILSALCPSWECKSSLNTHIVFILDYSGFLFRFLETEGQGCMLMPNPLSTKYYYIFLGIQFVIPSNKILSTTALEEARILKRFSSRSYGYLDNLCLEPLVCMSFTEIQTQFSWQDGVFLAESQQKSTGRTCPT